MRGEAGDFTGTHHLVRLILRRDRIRLPVWVAGILVMTGISAEAVQNFYETPAQIAAYAVTVESSAASRLFGGVPYDIGTIGGITAYEITSVGAIGLALMMIFLVVRHTRGEEESGTSEMVRSTIIGRHAATLATLLVAVGASLLVGLLDAAMLAGVGHPWSDGAAHGAALAGIGLAFTGVAATSAQVVASARGALALAGAVMALLFVGRGWAAAEYSDWVWVSPFAWGEGVRPFGETRWWLLLPLLGFAAVLLVLAGLLTARRDFGAGLVHPRAGRDHATSLLATPFGLALRTQRGLLIGWGVGLFLLGLVYGAFSEDIYIIAEANPDLMVIMGGDADNLVRGYYAFILAFTCILATAYTLASALRLRHDERAGLAEGVLATKVSRTRWALSGLAVTLGGSVLMMLLIGLGTAVMHVVTTGETDLFWPVVGGALSYLPAAVLLIGLAVLLHGFLPRLAPVVWVVFTYGLLQSYLGEILEFPDWLSGLSPFWHLPMLPADDFEAAPGAVLVLVGLLGVVGGVVGLRRRDAG